MQELFFETIQLGIIICNILQLHVQNLSINVAMRFSGMMLRCVFHRFQIFCFVPARNLP